MLEGFRFCLPLCFPILKRSPFHPLFGSNRVTIIITLLSVWYPFYIINFTFLPSSIFLINLFSLLYLIVMLRFGKLYNLRCVNTGLLDEYDSFQYFGWSPAYATFLWWSWRMLSHLLTIHRNHLYRATSTGILPWPSLSFPFLVARMTYL